MAQRKRKLTEEKRQIVKEETNKLLTASIIREIKYTTWLSNMVLVEKKTKGTWHMCVDFIDLNRACPKVSHPLPNIDKLVMQLQVMSFMDAYSGYNQI